MKRFVQFDRPIEDAEWLRLATLLDTEGSIQIKKLKSAVKWGCRQELKRFEFEITPEHEQVLAQLDPRSKAK